MTWFWRSNLMIRLRKWEYWSIYVIYFPIFFYGIWQAILSRSLFFFSASNPSIKNGGMFGCSKFKILELIPEDVKPITLFFQKGVSEEVALFQIESNKLQYPIIAKPDMGNRGWQVEKIKSENELLEYMRICQVNFIIQEYIDLPIELGVFYYCMPDQEQGVISSVVLKEMLKVTGDGNSTLRELMMKYDRAKLQVQFLAQKRGLSTVPPKGEEVELVAIGNHSRGATFLNGNHLITKQLRAQFDQLHKKIDGVFYGRYDLRCASYEMLNKGQMKIMEFNGANAEPAHIYHPGFSLLEAYRILFKHWKILGQISRANHQKGVKYMTMAEAKKLFLVERMAA